MTVKKILLVLTLISGSILSADQSTPIVSGKKPLLIQWGQMTPDTRLLKKYVSYWEEYLPFDGLVLSINKEKYAGRYGDTAVFALPESVWPLPWMAFSRIPARMSDYAHTIEDLQQTLFTKFLNNFVPLYLYAPQPSAYVFDWQDEDRWATVLENVKILATIAKKGGCKGIWFDTEQYVDCRYWNYQEIKKHLGIESEDKYRALVRRRGVEFIQAINAQFSDCELVLSFGSSIICAHQANQWANKATCIESPYGLLPSFIDGLLFGANEETKVTDGCEVSYYLREEEEFAKMKELTKNTLKRYSKIPEHYKEHIGVSFGLYPTFPRRPRRFSPQAFNQTVYYALKHTEHYVWVWNERETFWKKRGKTPMMADQASVDYFGEKPTVKNVFRKRDKGVSHKYIEAIEKAKARYSINLSSG